MLEKLQFIYLRTEVIFISKENFCFIVKKKKEDKLM